LVGQYNTAKDPVTHLIPWLAAASASTLTGLFVGGKMGASMGAQMGSVAGPYGAISGAGLGAGLGAVVGFGTMHGSLLKYHSMSTYLKNNVNGVRDTLAEVGK